MLTQNILFIEAPALFKITIKYPKVIKCRTIPQGGSVLEILVFLCAVILDIVNTVVNSIVIRKISGFMSFVGVCVFIKKCLYFIHLRFLLIIVIVYI